jgi:hypothetical protein
LLVYAGEDKEYFCFITAKAWNALKDWMEYREASGEQVNEQSWVMHNLWDTRVARGSGLVTRPKKLSNRNSSLVQISQTSNCVHIFYIIGIGTEMGLAFLVGSSNLLLISLPDQFVMSVFKHLDPLRV